MDPAPETTQTLAVLVRLGAEVVGADGKTRWQQVDSLAGKAVN